MRRREFIAGLGSAAAWPVAARAQQPAVPVIALINGAAAGGSADFAAAFRRGLGETGYVEGQNLIVEYHWLDSQYDRVPALIADLVRRRVSVIATPASTPARSARSIRPSPPLCESGRMPFLSCPTHFSPTAGCNWPTWRRARGFRLLMHSVFQSKSAG